MILLLQRLYRQTLGTLDSDPLHRTMSAQPIAELACPRDVVSDLALMNYAAAASRMQSW